MSWIVLGEDKGEISLVSSREIDGIAPKGTYLTVENEKKKYIVRVTKSFQTQPYNPSPLLIDMNLEGLEADKKCQNIIKAVRIKDISDRDDGLIDFIRPQLKARRSTVQEVKDAVKDKKDGIPIFLSTVFANSIQILKDNNKNPIHINLHDDIFFHQILICGKTGRGKTVASKYLAQFFVEKIKGAVLAVNVKETDLIKMYKKSETKDASILKEWDAIGESAHGMFNFQVYYPSNTSYSPDLDIDRTYFKPITLNINEIDPESLKGILNNITDIAAHHLPDIFRHWKDFQTSDDYKFMDFYNYFSRNDNREFPTLNLRGDEAQIKLPYGTYQNILRNLNSAAEFFDDPDGEFITENNILNRETMSVIDVANKNGINFGAILLRDLLKRIEKAKTEGKSNVPILIIIDEVHQFYKNANSAEALGDLDVICRTGRSKKIGVIFSSQNPNDIPKGLESVINTKIFFGSEHSVIKKFGFNVSENEIENLERGYALATIYGTPQVKFIKFPLSFSGVFT
ncbi:ATP-binding protein [Promethearchaeum syntrophicum]|uniref:ATP-binding protein n=1 Tax=Promethearchaeum syntrophicum TaxID=2594042 RepID=A0A5B9DEL2_9ARCH